MQPGDCVRGKPERTDDQHSDHYHRAQSGADPSGLRPRRRGRSQSIAPLYVDDYRLTQSPSHPVPGSWAGADAAKAGIEVFKTCGTSDVTVLETRITEIRPFYWDLAGLRRILGMS